MVLVTPVCGESSWKELEPSNASKRTATYGLQQYLFDTDYEAGGMV